MRLKRTIKRIICLLFTGIFILGNVQVFATGDSTYTVTLQDRTNTSTRPVRGGEAVGDLPDVEGRHWEDTSGNVVTAETIINGNITIVTKAHSYGDPDDGVCDKCGYDKYLYTVTLQDRTNTSTRPVRGGEAVGDLPDVEGRHWEDTSGNVVTAETIINGNITFVTKAHSYGDPDDGVCDKCGYDKSLEVVVQNSYATTDGSGKYLTGDTVTVDAGVRNGYEFSGWTSDNVTFDDSKATKTTFIMPTTAVTVVANWTESKNSDSKNFDWEYWAMSVQLIQNTRYNINATAGEGGTISSEGVTKVKYGSNVTYTITPDEGYEIESVVVNGIDQGAITEYTFKSIQSKQEISATFKKVEEPTAEIPVWGNPFTDVAEEDAFYEAVQFVYKNNLFEGTSDTTFDPTITMNRGMFATVLGRIAGVDVTAYTRTTFEDVVLDEYYATYVAWAVENGIAKGYGDGTFGVNDEVTIEQAIVFISRLADLYDVEIDSSEIDFTQYADADDVSDWASIEMLWALESGIYNVDDAILNPQGKAERWLVAEMVYNFYKVYMN